MSNQKSLAGRSRRERRRPARSEPKAFGRAGVPFLPCCLILLVFPLLAHGATLRATNSISQAVAAAQDGDIILVQGPNVFHEHVVIEKRVRLIGENSPVLDGDASGTPVTIKAEGAEV